MITVGDSLEVLAAWEPESIDAVVTDPPYGIGFMGHEWDQPGDFGAVRASGKSTPAHPRERAARRFVGDHGKTNDRATSMQAGRYDLGRTANGRYQAWCEAWGAELWRVLKPGGHVLSFGGTRTFHRLTSGLEDAGFEIRDVLVWGYANGFPKSLDVSKAIDKVRDDRADVEAIRRYLREARDRLGMTNRQVAEAFGFTPTMAAHWIDHPSQPTLPTLEQWARLKELLDLGDDLDAEVERLNGRKGTPGEAWLERPVTGEVVAKPGSGVAWSITSADGLARDLAISDEARRWQGWGTALKPGWEPIVLARKPLRGSIADNVVRYGTGGLNVEATRIPWASDQDRADQARLEGFRGQVGNVGGIYGGGKGIPKTDDVLDRGVAGDDVGRWPANVILTDPIFDGDHEPDVVGGGWQSGGGNPARVGADAAARSYGGFSGGETGKVPVDTAGTYSRFFLIPKPNRTEREFGLEGFPTGQPGSFQPTQKRCPICGDSWIVGGWPSCGHGEREFVEAPNVPRANVHPTVKPIALIRHLIRLVTPPGGIVVDPFLGSGTTAVAASLEGFEWRGIERDPHYAAIAQGRVDGWAPLAAEEAARRGQLGLFDDEPPPPKMVAARAPRRPRPSPGIFDGLESTEAAG